MSLIDESAMKVSVAMTTYNGKKYILEQLESILKQLDSCDEVVICDDGSTDGTIEILTNIQKSDSRVNLFLNNRLGVVKNFEFAILKCKNDIIILSDQDDIWNQNKVRIIKANFSNTNKKLLLHNANNYSCDTEGSLLITNMQHGVVKNIIFSSYWGCCMAFKKEFVQEFSPFPNGLSAHDQWIGLIAEKNRESLFINESLIKHRNHEFNVTKKMNLLNKIVFRYNMAKIYIVYLLQKSKSL